MISVILSSYKPELFKACAQNVQDTIGVPYEIIRIENPGRMSIAEAYNKGISQARYDVLCCIHEDILFNQNNWGHRLLDVLSDPETGVVGVAGSKVMGNAPGAWWDFGAAHYVRNLIQHIKGQAVHQTTFTESADKNGIEEVAVVDGVFLAFRRDADMKFNEAIPGFHAYDLSISMEARRKALKVVVADGILLEHFSTGTIDKGWYDAMDKFYEIYSKDLPVIRSATPGDLASYEREAFKSYIQSTPDKRTALKYWKKLFFRNPFSKFHIAFLKSKILKN